jgi:dihydrodipicolinate synthase/N-acetylneuraminate lyase
MSNDKGLVRGVIAIPQTPFHPDGTIDGKALLHGVRDRLESGVAALMFPVIASETTKLTLTERRRILELVLGEVSKVVPTFVGTYGATLEDSLEIGRLAVSLGATGLLVLPPQEAMTSVDALSAFLHSMLATGTDMLMLQDLDWHGPGLPVETILETVHRVPELRCIKVESTPAGIKYTALREQSGGKLHLSGGWAVTQLIEALDRKVDAVAVGGNHWAFTRIIDLYDRGDRNGARALFDRVVPFLAFTHQHIDLSNWALKEVAVRHGIYQTSTLRSPQMVIDGYHRRVGYELINDMVALDHEMRTIPIDPAVKTDQRRP